MQEKWFNLYIGGHSKDSSSLNNRLLDERQISTIRRGQAKDLTRLVVYWDQDIEPFDFLSTSTMLWLCSERVMTAVIAEDLRGFVFNPVPLSTISGQKEVFYTIATCQEYRNLCFGSAVPFGTETNLRSESDVEEFMRMNPNVKYGMYLEPSITGLDSALSDIYIGPRVSNDLRLMVSERAADVFRYLGSKNVTLTVLSKMVASSALGAYRLCQ